MASTSPIIVWFCSDLRLADHPALQAALQDKAPVIPVFIQNSDKEKWAPGGASRWWLHHSLKALQNSLKQRGNQLILRKGEPFDELEKLIQATNAQAVYWNHGEQPSILTQEQKLNQRLKKISIKTKAFNGSLLFEPWELATQNGKPYQVFTPFWKALQKEPEPRAPFPSPQKIPGVKGLTSLPLKAFELEPKIDWAGGIRATWTPGEKGAQQTLKTFLKNLAQYHLGRDRPDQVLTSRLSPHLHFGEISPHQVWHAVKKQLSKTPQNQTSAISYLRELAWREFAYHLLFHFPHTTEHPLRKEFKNFSWRQSRKDLKAWQQGQTGYPLVDAGMRELWHTGWMHNRVRMVVASFLVKDLLISWQEGAKWFWDTLVDADLANNTLGWQWTAGCGADAAPFFRIFNPTTQAEKFDPQASYIRKWVEEIAKLPTPWIYRPWEAPQEVLRKANVQIGKNYPQPMVDHAWARERALAALAEIKK